jgi:hypothetical protein
MKGIFMSVLRTLTAAGLIALTLGGASVATTTSASASERGAFWGGVTAGVVGGALAAEAVRPAYPVYYDNGPAYETVRWRRYHRCFWTWRRDRWGHAHRVRICR